MEEREDGRKSAPVLHIIVCFCTFRNVNDLPPFHDKGGNKRVVFLLYDFKDYDCRILLVFITHHHYHRLQK